MKPKVFVGRMVKFDYGDICDRYGYFLQITHSNAKDQDYAIIADVHGFIYTVDLRDVKFDMGD